MPVYEAAPSAVLPSHPHIIDWWAPLVCAIVAGVLLSVRRCHPSRHVFLASSLSPTYYWRFRPWVVAFFLMAVSASGFLIVHHVNDAQVAGQVAAASVVISFLLLMLLCYRLERMFQAFRQATTLRVVASPEQQLVGTRGDGSVFVVVLKPGAFVASASLTERGVEKHSETQSFLQLRGWDERGHELYLFFPVARRHRDMLAKVARRAVPRDQWGLCPLHAGQLLLDQLARYITLP